jgi:hypothetical protein
MRFDKSGEAAFISSVCDQTTVQVPVCRLASALDSNPCPNTPEVALGKQD